MIDPAKVCLWVPAGLKDFKLDLFERIARHISSLGGRVVRHDLTLLQALPDGIIPIIGCQPDIMPLIEDWRRRGKTWIYWDRGYARRVFATHLPRAANTAASFYRWHVCSFQARSIRSVPGDRWARLRIDDCIKPWAKGGKHIVIAAPTRTYARFHRCENWIADTVDALARVTRRQLVIRDKASLRTLQEDIAGAHALVAHGSIAAVESVICGCPVFVHPDSAAALVGKTSLNNIENPVYPERQPWLNSLAYDQYNEHELVDGTLWNLIDADHPLPQH